MSLIKQDLVKSSKYNIKCPYSMNPIGISIHNTYNNASAKNEISYMKSNNNKVSFHIAVDDVEAIQGLPLDRNSWSCGDGSGQGNINHISIEICYSKDGGTKFIAAEKRAAKVVAELLRKYGWGINRVKAHRDFANKNCPHRTNMNEFKKLIEKELKGAPTSNSSIKYKNGDYNRKARTTANLNIRNERSTSSKIIKTIPKGTVLEVNYCLNNWFSTYDYKYNNKPCYVSADYIELI